MLAEEGLGGVPEMTGDKGLDISVVDATRGVAPEAHPVYIRMARRCRPASSRSPSDPTKTQEPIEPNRYMHIDILASRFKKVGVAYLQDILWIQDEPFIPDGRLTLDDTAVHAQIKLQEAGEYAQNLWMTSRQGRHF